MPSWFWTKRPRRFRPSAAWPVSFLSGADWVRPAGATTSAVCRTDFQQRHPAGAFAHRVSDVRGGRPTALRSLRVVAGGSPFAVLAGTGALFPVMKPSATSSSASAKRTLRPFGGRSGPGRCCRCLAAGPVHFARLDKWTRRFSFPRFSTPSTHLWGSSERLSGRPLQHFVRGPVRKLNTRQLRDILLALQTEGDYAGRLFSRTRMKYTKLQLWDRFQKYYTDYPSIGLALHLTRRSRNQE